MDEVQEKSNESSDEDNEINVSNINRNRKLKILDSDSDSEGNVPPEGKLDDKSTIEEGPLEPTRTELKRITSINSDSEASDDEVTPHNKSFPDEETAVEAVIYSTNNKGELVPEEGSANSIQKSRFSTLCDSESSEDEEKEEIRQEVEDESAIKPIAYKSRRKGNDEDKPKRMTAQEAAKQRTEIQSESQRRLRETNVSLPYHIPKSYTMREFLEKRAKLASALPLIPKVPPSIAIKMSKDRLMEVSKKLDERIKQVEEFYKSESEDDEEEERKIAVKEIRSWLDLLVDNAVDSVEAKSEVTISEEAPNQFSMDYDFTLDDLNEDESPKKTNIGELLNEEVLNSRPKLSGGPDDVIDLDEGVARPSGVKKLVEKFFQHAIRKFPQKHKVHLNIVGVSGGGEIVKETVSMIVEEEEEPATMETPGAKLQKLREELQSQMAKRRSELWKQKQEQGECLDVEKNTKLEVEEEAEKDILDDDEEEEIEMTESEEEDEDDEDISHSEKPKSAFIEDEASEDQPEDLEEDDADDNDGFDGDVEEMETEESPKKKTLRRILKPFAEDSDDEEEPTKDITVVRSTKKSNDSSDEDEFIPPNLPRANITPQRPQPDNNKTDFDFLTPVSFLTGLQNLNSESKFLKDSPVISNSEESPSNESSLQKKLFSEPSDQSQDSQAMSGNIEDLASMICSGKFPQSQDVSSEERMSEEMVPTTQDLLDVCSGGFTDIPTTCSEKVVIRTDPDEEIKNLDEDYGQIISQLLDEDELERFKKKFESPVANASKTRFEDTEVSFEEVNATGLIDSDNEDGLEIKTRKKQKKLVFSDDDESSNGEEDLTLENEEIDLHDSDDEEQQLEDEIEAQESANYKAADFLDKEAELSESEWGSADEDEKDLDDLEFEQGDQEVFNETKVRSELERIHMRQVLDDDNREVKLLQELLLEDGELHGSGRQRQFKWKALDSMDSSEFEKRDDDDIYLEDEEESEEQWRKMRYKREMFLKKKSMTEDVDSILSDSQIFKIGQQVFKNSQSFGSLNNTPVEKTEVQVTEPFSLLKSKRGSFLSRNDQVLQRLAEYNKVTESVVGTSAKNSRCFVFQTVESTGEVTVIKDNNNKRKATDGTPAAIKKLRLSDLSPAVNKKNAGKSTRAKKLFGNW